MSLISVLLSADPSRRLFARGDGWVTAADIHAMAARALPVIDAQEKCFLHTASAAHFVAGVLAAASCGKPIVLPAHAQPDYLVEIGCKPGALIGDACFADGQTPQSIADAVRDPLLTFFTSGTTGEPKPVEKNVSRLEAEVAALEAVWGGETSHVVGTVSHQHIYGLLYRIVWPLMCGRTADDTAAAYWEDLQGRLSGATLISSPAHLTRLPPRPDIFTPSPGIIFSSGQLLAANAAAACAAAFGKPVTEVLGSTETGGIAWRRRTPTDELWTPLPNVDVSAGEDGALTVRSAHLQTKAALTTGDTIALESDGRFRLLPRSDRVAKIDGKRISLPRVEAALVKLHEVDDAAALTLPSPNEALAAVVVLSQAGKAQLAKDGAFRLSRHFRIALSAALEPAERPKHWRFVDAVPANQQGKRVLSTLRELFAAPSPVDALDMDIRSFSDSEAEVAFTLRPEFIFFNGHFTGRAILPGVAQVHLAALIAERLWEVWPSSANLSRLKFRRVLLPGDAVVLRLKYDPAMGRITFAYRFGDIIASQGEIGGVATS